MVFSISKLFHRNPVERFAGIVAAVNARESELRTRSDEDIRAASLKLREDVQKAGGSTEETLTERLPEAFALVREAARRRLGQRHYDVQLIGGIVLHEGKIVEMMTGEGKTLAATLPAYLNALAGRGVHVVTVNDYLARRDTVWMGQIYHALGLTISCIVHDAAFQYDPAFEGSELDRERDVVGSFRVIEKFLRPIRRGEAYRSDITYGTNHEFGFDYLRDNLVARLVDRVQRPHAYAIIDEVDSILIDEARTPLIIAAPDQASSEYYKTFARIAARLEPETDYTVDEKLKAVSMTDAGFEKVEKAIGVQNIFDPEHSRLVHFLQESVKAHALFKRDKDYVVKDSEVLIVDEFTGRILHGRRYSGGLHQAIEAKEGVLVKEENRTFAQITIQNYFRLYQKIAGMTGTAQTSAEEFHKVYGLDVESIPPNKPTVRDDRSDVVYKTKEAKYRAVAKDVKECQERGQPVLLGTTSIRNNETISEYLREAGVAHEVLNAKNNDREGEIIAQAGRPGAVTVATNMAGRGVDIVLGGNPPDPEAAKKVVTLGGLHVIGTERHEARRIDNQLRGRSGRQGDPGSTRFFLSLEDDLMRIFGGDRITRLMKAVNFPEDIPIESGMVSKAVNQAQQKVEGANFDLRKHLLDFDDVLNKQRTAVYTKRNTYLTAGDTNEILPHVRELLESVATAAEASLPTGQAGLSTETEHVSGPSADTEREKKLAEVRTHLASIPESVEPERAVVLAQHLVRVIDMLWVDHLENLESLRDSVNIRAYGQHEPIVEYRRDAHGLYKRLQENLAGLTWNTIFPLFTMDITRMNADQARNDAEKSQRDVALKKIGRNDPCWCGSGKKYKRCHGA